MNQSTDMRYRLFAGKRMLGTTDLPHLDLSMGFASGPFVPSSNYKQVQSVFRMKTEAISHVAGSGDDEEMLAEYRDALQGPDLRIETAAGVAIPTNWIDIDDFSVELGPDDEGAIEITAHLPDLSALDAAHLVEAERARAERWGRPS